MTSLKALVLWLFLISQFAISQVHCFKVNDGSSGKRISEMYLQIYQKNNATVYLPNDKHRFCLERIKVISADSIILKTNFQKFNLDKESVLNDKINVTLSISLDAVVLENNRTLFTYGPTKPYSNPFINNTLGYRFAVGFEIDSISSSKSIEGMKIRFRGRGVTIPSRSYQSQVRVQLYYAKNKQFDGIQPLLNESSQNTYVIDFKGSGWLEIDLLSYNLVIPENGYFIMSFEIVKGTVVVSQFRGKNNSKFDGLKSDNRVEKGKIFRIVDNLDLPAIKLELF